MDIFVVIQIVLISVLVIITAILLHDSVAYKRFLAVALFGLAGWRFLSLMTTPNNTYFQLTYNLGITALNIAVIGWVLFSLFFTRLQRHLVASVLAWGTVAALTICALGAPFGLVISDMHFAHDDLYTPLLVPGALYSIQDTALAIGVVMGIVLLAIGYQQKRLVGSISRSSMFWILTALVMTVSLNLAASWLFPESNIVEQLGISAIVLTGMVFAYVIGIRREFDVKAAAVRTVAYALTILTLGLAYYLIAYLASSLFLKGKVTNGVSFSPINIALALILALLFQPFKRFFDHLTNKIFYKDRYDTDDFIARLSRVLTSTTQLHQVLTKALEEITTTLKSSGGLFIVYRDHHDDVLVGRKRYDDFKETDYELVRHIVLTHGDRVLVVDPSASGDDESQQHLHRVLARHHVALVLPLVSSTQTIGYLLLGEQLAGGYAKRDIAVLETVADELVIAIQNARSVQVVRDLNTHLEERVSSATKELRASNKRLMELDAMKDEFVSMASHQLRTPLTSVKGYISMVLEGDAGKISKPQRQLLEEAFTSSERMVHLISDFLNVSRLQTGKFVVDPKEVDLAEVTKQEVANIGQIAASHQVNVRYTMPTRFPTLYLDEGKIRQVIMNFIDNAIYYSPDANAVKVTLSVEDGDAVLRVIDHGMGVPEEAKKKLFSKFFRAENARKQRPDGTGVGLFLAKKVIDGHGGKLVFESEVGKGSTFGFRLPIKKLSKPPTPDAQTSTM
jgi:signal transduction histidine kinase